MSDLRIAWSREGNEGAPSDVNYLGEASEHGHGDALRFDVREEAPPVEPDGSPDVFFRSVQARGASGQIRCAGAAFQVTRGAVEGRCLGWSAEHELAASIALRLLLAHEGWIHVHGAGVVFSEKAVLFVGGSGSGKTTTALACVTAGHGLMSDDGVFLRVRGDQIEAIGVARPPHVTPRTAGMFPGLVLGEEVEGGFKRLASLPREAFATAVFPVARVVFPEIVETSSTGLCGVRPSEGLALLLGSCTPAMIPSFPASVPAIDVLCRVAELPLFSLRLGSDAAKDARVVVSSALST